jgi:hypothetical protein
VQSHYGNAIEGLKRFTEYQVQEMENEKRKMEDIIMIDFEEDDIKSEMNLDVKGEKKEEVTESTIDGVSSKYFKSESVDVKTETPNGSTLLNIENTIDSHVRQVEEPLLSKTEKMVDLISSLPFAPIKIEPGYSANSNDRTQGTKNAAELMPPPPMAALQTLCCVGCSQWLMRGPKANLKSVNVFDLQSIRSITRSPSVTELCGPGTWEVYPTRLMGSPLDVCTLPPLCDVVYDRVDGICYRFLFCACNKAQPLGFVICAAVDPTKKHHVGKVYLWNVPQVMEPISQDDLNKEIPNSQYSSSNDIFYGL